MFCGLSEKSDFEALRSISAEIGIRTGQSELARWSISQLESDEDQPSLKYVPSLSSQGPSDLTASYNIIISASVIRNSSLINQSDHLGPFSGMFLGGFFFFFFNRSLSGITYQHETSWCFVRMFIKLFSSERARIDIVALSVTHACLLVTYSPCVSNVDVPKKKKWMELV